MKIYFHKLLIVFLGSLILIPFFVQADTITLDNPLKANTFKELIDKIVDILWTLALLTAPVMLIVAGYFFLTAAGNPNNINTARNIIMWTLIGLGVIAAANGLITLFEEQFPSPTP